MTNKNFVHLTLVKSRSCMITVTWDEGNLALCCMGPNNPNFRQAKIILISPFIFIVMWSFSFSIVCTGVSTPLKNTTPLFLAKPPLTLSLQTVQVPPPPSPPPHFRQPFLLQYWFIVNTFHVMFYTLFVTETHFNINTLVQVTSDFIYTLFIFLCPSPFWLDFVLSHKALFLLRYLIDLVYSYI